MAVWTDFARVTDQFVDALFGEKVRLLPYTKPGMSAPYPDMSRIVVDGVGIEETTATTNTTQVGGMITRTVEADLLISIRMEWIKAARLNKGDRVVMLERGNEILEVTLVEPDTTDRTRVHLVRIKGE